MYTACIRRAGLIGKSAQYQSGWVAERSIAPVLKTGAFPGFARLLSLTIGAEKPCGARKQEEICI